MYKGRNYDMSTFLREVLYKKFSKSDEQNYTALKPEEIERLRFVILMGM